MKLSKNNKTSTRGFTLIELLVVIAIIATLGGLSFGPIMKYLGTAKITKVKKVCKDLTFAITGFEQEYDSLPYSGNTYPSVDASYRTGGVGRPLLKVLIGADTNINDKGKRFFVADEAKGRKDGFTYFANGSIENLYDTWGNVYTIRLDYDADGIIDASVIGTYSDTLRVGNSIVVSPGKDGLYDDNQDAKSW